MYAEKINDNDAILACIGEAENQGYKGLLLIASAIRNRGTLRGVYGLNSLRVRKRLYTSEIYLEAKRAWYESEKDNIAKGADSWYSSEDVKKLGKVTDRKFLFKHGNHYFYKLTKNKRRKT